ncbi:MAG TPA: hypothetical protein VGZ47_11985, partial [Gemmataceae bacterium]|nr:hypothetical protein [Gemmataceae bacterium]
MKLLILILTSALAIGGVACAPKAKSPGSEQPAQAREVPPSVRVLVLEGNPRQRGLTHGRVMKEDIHKIVGLWKSTLAEVFKLDADAFIHRFVAQTDFVAAMKKWTPDLLEEIHGLAEGAEIDFDTMLILQLPDECFINGEAVAKERCSSLGFARSAGRPACVAQNMDVPAFADGFQLVLH